MDYELAGKSVIITGGASHIGRAIALGFAREGSAIAILDRDAAQAELTAKHALELGATRADVVAADLSTPEPATRAVQDAIALLRGVDVLVNNVGGSIPNFFSRMPLSQWESEISLNLLTPIVVTRAVLDTFVAQQHGAVVSISSVAAWGEPRAAVYGAAKAGVNALMCSLAKEHGRDGIRFNTVAPGTVIADDVDEESIGTGSVWTNPSQIWASDEQLDSVRRQIPLRRLPRPEDIAEAVLFFASDRAAHQLTGQLLCVSGGFHTTT
jgi:2-hydroxycyclohexanecarboxyl-CoA dehydrogenase